MRCKQSNGGVSGIVNNFVNDDNVMGEDIRETDSFNSTHKNPKSH